MLTRGCDIIYYRDMKKRNFIAAVASASLAVGAANAVDMEQRVKNKMTECNGKYANFTQKTPVQIQDQQVRCVADFVRDSTDGYNVDMTARVGNGSHQVINFTAMPAIKDATATNFCYSYNRVEGTTKYNLSKHEIGD